METLTPLQEVIKGKVEFIILVHPLIPLSEAIEDLTGGVGNEIHITDILDRNKFWQEELMNVNNEFLFGCVTGAFDGWRDEEPMIARQGITRMHSYTILEAKEVEGKRLMKIRYPIQALTFTVTHDH